MKIVVFIFIQFGSLLFYAAHASNIKEVSPPSIEHLFSPSVTISNERNLTELTITTEQNDFLAIYDDTLGTFAPLLMPITVKAAGNFKYLFYVRSSSSSCRDYNIDDELGWDTPLIDFKFQVGNSEIIMGGRPLPFIMNEDGMMKLYLRTIFSPIEQSINLQRCSGTISLSVRPVSL